MGTLPSEDAVVPPPEFTSPADQPTDAGDGVASSGRGLSGPETVPQTGAAAHSRTTEASGATAAGRYRIVRPHAHGGLGEVFLARDEELGRDVALKRLRPRRADDPDSRRRFVAEAAVTARLEHPGVVPVHGLVTDADGRPCYAMRFVQGDTFADAIARFHKSPSFDSLEFRQLLARFVAVCNAIAYAHSRGVIHRDLKPANVMLGPFGETLVVDWGLAKVAGHGPAGAHESEDANSSRSTGPSTDSDTQTGEILGTPAYMAPEQAEGQTVTAAADVYGLGGILYTLLTGSPPGRGRSALEVLDRVRTGDVPPPRLVNPAVPRPLDAVCRRAMAPDPAARYPSSLTLVADVERWLADEPVSADREPWRERARRWVKRHRTLVTTAVAVLVLAVAGLTAATVVVSREQAATAEARRRAEEQRDRADHNLELAQRAVDTAVNRVSGHPRLQAGDFHDLRAELLGALIPFFEDLARQSGEDPTAVAKRGLALSRLGNLRDELGQTADAERAYRRSVAVFADLAARQPDEPEFRRLLAKARSNLGTVLRDAGRHAEARTEVVEAVRLKRELVDDVDGRFELAAGLNNLALGYDEAGHSEAAEAAFREALQLGRAVVTERPGDLSAAAQCASVEGNLAILLKTRGRPGEAEPLYRSALARREALAAARADDPRARHDLAQCRYNLANLLLAAGRHAEAEAEYRLAVAGYEALVAGQAAVPAYRRELANGLSNLSVIRSVAGRPDEALDLLRRAAVLFERLASDFPAVGEFRHAIADNWFNRGRALEYLAVPADADAAYRRAADEYSKLAAVAPGGPAAVSLATTWTALGDLARSTGGAAAALDWYDKALARLGGTAARDARRDAHAGRAEALDQLGRPSEATRAWDAAFDLVNEAHRPRLRLRRARSRAATGAHAAAAAEAREVAATSDASAVATAFALDGAARVLARAAAAAKTDPAAESYAADAVAFLRRAHAIGMYREPKAADRLREDADFAAVRERSDFRDFVAEVGGK